MQTEVNNRITAEEADRLMSDTFSELTKYYRGVQQDVYLLLARAQKEGWNEEKFIRQVGELFEDDRELQ